MNKFAVALLALAIVFMVPLGSVDARAEQSKASESPNELSGDGVPNNTEDEEYGEYGAGESPNPISGDGVPNRTQDEEYGQYGSGTGASGADAPKPQTQAQERVQVRAASIEELQDLINSELEDVQDAAADFGEDVRSMAREHGRMDVAVLAFMASENLVVPFGQQVSELAQQIGSSTQEMYQAEERIETRSWVRNMLFGGDIDAAERIRTQVEQNAERVEQLQQHLSDSELSEQLRATLEEQLENMEAEQERLRNLAENEQGHWGLLSWLF